MFVWPYNSKVAVGPEQAEHQHKEDMKLKTTKSDKIKYKQNIVISQIDIS